MNKKKIIYFRQVIISFIVLLFLTKALFSNVFWQKIVIIPFLVCAFANIIQNTALLLDKKEIAKKFGKMYAISFFTYIFGFLLFAIYRAFATSQYFILLIVIPMLIFLINFLKNEKKE